MSELAIARQEMNAYCRYFVGKNADTQSLNLFESAIQHEATVLSARELKIMEFMLRNEWSIGFIDSATGMFQPQHRLRKRIIVAFAILETNLLYYDYFRPARFGTSHLLTLVYYGIKEGLMAIGGSIILALF